MGNGTAAGLLTKCRNEGVEHAGETGADCQRPDGEREPHVLEVGLARIGEVETGGAQHRFEECRGPILESSARDHSSAHSERRSAKVACADAKSSPDGGGRAE